jgi:hypothetical protein
VTRLVAGQPNFNSRQDRIFLFSTASRPAPGPTQLLIQRAPGYFLGVKQPKREADHSSPSSVGANAWSETSTSPYVCIAWCLIKHMNNFTLLLGVCVLKSAVPYGNRHHCTSSVNTATRPNYKADVKATSLVKATPSLNAFGC